MRAKIIETSFLALGLLFVIKSAIGYYLAYLDCVDDELMWLYGFNLIVVTCVVVLGGLLLSAICSVWKKENKEK